jgi:hypothetical protein
VFVSKNLIQNMLMFPSGLGFSILGLLFGMGVCFFDIMLLGGISRQGCHADDNGRMDGRTNGWTMAVGHP